MRKFYFDTNLSFLKVYITHHVFIMVYCFFPAINYAQSLTEISSSIGVGGGCSGIYGNGVSFYDWDSDGYDDIVLLDDQFSVRFYKNTNGLFVGVDMPGIEVTGAVKSVNWVDINNDKEPDIAFNLAPGTFKLFLNTGDFHFTDISATCGIEQITSMGYGQSWGDYDKDGFLDVYINNYQSSQVQPQRTNYLYRNNGDGTFTNTTDLAGVDNGYQTTFVSVWMDYDKDSWPDLFVLNDRFQFANALYRNNGDGTFTDVSDLSGFNGMYEPMSASVGDFNNDQNLDIYSTNTQGNKLYENLGNGVFIDVAAMNNAQMFIFTWGAIWMDIDGDLKEDLVVASGNTFGSYNSLYLLMNTGSGFESAQNYGFSTSEGTTFAIASGDIDNDGKQEILSHGLYPQGTKLWTSNGFNYTYLKINLNGVVSNREGTGSWIEAYSNGVTQTRYTLSGEQYLSQNTQWEFFGFQSIEVIDSLIIRWPSGIIDRFIDLPTNQILTINEGQTFSCQISSNEMTHPCSGDTIILDAGEWGSYLWQDGSTERYYTVVNSGEFYVSVATNGIEISSNVLNINYANMSDYTILIEEPECHNSGHGTVKIMNADSIIMENVTWNSSELGPLFSSLPDALINFSFTDNFGCEFSGETIINQPDSLHIEVSALLNDDFGACPNTWNGEADISGGMPPYDVNWEFFLALEQTPFDAISGPSFNCIPDAEVLRLTCSVTDANACIFESEIMLQAPITGINNQPNNSMINAVPNPFNSTIRLTHLNSQAFIRVHDLTGKTVKQVMNVDNNTDLNFVDLKSGVYTMEIVQESLATYRRIVKN